MPTPLPGDPNRDEFFVLPNILNDLASKFENIRPGFSSFAQQELRDLGFKLVPLVKAATPKASGRLARSTKHRVIRVRDSSSGESSFELQIIQDATARGVRTVRGRYFYWYSVHHGLQPAGRLSNTFPPFENLIPWAVKRFGVDEKTGRVIARKVAWKIRTKGIEPNTYLIDVMREAEDLIQKTADRIGQSIIVDLTRLPNIVIPAGGFTRE